MAASSPQKSRKRDGRNVSLTRFIVLVPAIRNLFHLSSGACLLAAMIVLAIMILPSIISVSETALNAVPREYEEASLALGATELETYFRVSVPAAKSGIAAARKGSGDANLPETERDLPMKWMLIALLLFVLPLLGLYQAIVQNWGVSVPMTIIMIVAGFLFYATYRKIRRDMV
mgnify:CR=1 FL=1